MFVLGFIELKGSSNFLRYILIVVQNCTLEKDLCMGFHKGLRILRNSRISSKGGLLPEVILKIVLCHVTTVVFNSVMQFVELNR